MFATGWQLFANKEIINTLAYWKQHHVFLNDKAITLNIDDIMSSFNGVDYMKHIYNNVERQRTGERWKGGERFESIYIYSMTRLYINAHFNKILNRYSMYSFHDIIDIILLYGMPDKHKSLSQQQNILNALIELITDYGHDRNLTVINKYEYDFYLLQFKQKQLLKQLADPEWNADINRKELLQHLHDLTVMLAHQKTISKELLKAKDIIWDYYKKRKGLNDAVIYFFRSMKHCL